MSHAGLAATPPPPASAPAGLPARMRQAASRFKLPLSSSGASVLALALGETTCQGMAVQLAGTRLKVLRFAEVAIDAPPRRVRPRILALLDKLDATGPAIRDVVIISPEAQGVAVELPPVHGKKKQIQRAQAAREETARNEVAKMLDYPVDMALVSHVPLALPADLTFDFEEHEELEDVLQPGMCFAVSRKHYATVENVLKESKKRLLGILPPEAFAFATGQAHKAACVLPKGKEPLGDEAWDGDPTEPARCLVHVGAMELHGARLGCEGVERFAVEPLHPGESITTALPRLLPQLSEPYEVISIMVGGVQPGEEPGPDMQPVPEAEALLTSLTEPSKPFAIERLAFFGAPGEMELLEAPGPISPRYMAPAGAAAAALARDKGLNSLLLHSRVPLTRRVSGNAYFLPICIVGLAMLGMGAAQAFTIGQTKTLQVAMSALEERKQGIQAQVDQKNRLEGQIKSLRRDISQQQATKALLEGELAQRTYRQALLLRGLVADTPQDVMLTRFEQLSHTSYTLEGVGMNSVSISQYLLQLRNTSIVKDTRLVQTTPARASSDSPDMDLLAFTIRIQLEEG